MRFFRSRGRLQIESALLLGLLAALAFTQFYLPSRERHRQTMAREAALQEELHQLREKARRLEALCAALQAREPEVVERVIRQELGWGRENEVVVIFPESDRMARKGTD